jgi:hypothetical protein
MPTIDDGKMRDIQKYAENKHEGQTSEEITHIFAINLVHILNERAADSSYSPSQKDCLTNLRHRLTHDYFDVDYDPIIYFINNLKYYLENPEAIPSSPLFQALISSEKKMYECYLATFMSYAPMGEKTALDLHKASLNYWYAQNLLEISEHLYPPPDQKEKLQDLYYAWMFWELMDQLSDSDDGKFFLTTMQIAPAKGTYRNAPFHGTYLTPPHKWDIEALTFARMWLFNDREQYNIRVKLERYVAQVKKLKGRESTLAEQSFEKIKLRIRNRISGPLSAAPSLPIIYLIKKTSLLNNKDTELAQQVWKRIVNNGITAEEAETLQQAWVKMPRQRQESIRQELSPMQKAIIIRAVEGKAVTRDDTLRMLLFIQKSLLGEDNKKGAEKLWKNIQRIGISSEDGKFFQEMRQGMSNEEFRAVMAELTGMQKAMLRIITKGRAISQEEMNLTLLLTPRTSLDARDKKVVENILTQFKRGGVTQNQAEFLKFIYNQMSDEEKTSLRETFTLRENQIITSIVEMTATISKEDIAGMLFLVPNSLLDGEDKDTVKEMWDKFKTDGVTKTQAKILKGIWRECLTQKDQSEIEEKLSPDQVAVIKEVVQKGNILTKEEVIALINNSTLAPNATQAIQNTGGPLAAPTKRKSPSPDSPQASEEKKEDENAKKVKTVVKL